MDFAENLITMRHQRGWSQEELGSRIGVTRQTVSKWEMGQSTPELEKLVDLSALFHVSLDEMVGVEGVEGRELPLKVQTDLASTWNYGVIYEYSSPIKVFGLPLVHIRWGVGPQLAKGIIAIGNCAVGVVSIGGCALGLASMGGVSLGLLFSLGGVSLGLLSLGGLAVGGFAVGGCAIGQWLAIGGGALSNYLAVGGGAISRGLAVGGSAYGHIAVGINQSDGLYTFLQGDSMETVWSTVKQEFPHMWGWVKGLIQAVV